MYKRIILLFSFICYHILLMGQTDSLNNVVRYLSTNDLVGAKRAADAAYKNVKTATLLETYYYRGFTYKEIYKATERKNKYSPARIVSVEMFTKLIKNDSTHKYADALKNLTYIASTYNNDAKELVDSVKYKEAKTLFDNYKKCMKVVDPKFDERAKDIEFYLAVGTATTAYFMDDEVKHLEYLSITDNTFKKVLEIDSNNIKGYYNLGMLYYNYGVHLINNMDPEIDLNELNKLQDKALVNFKAALPYMLKAYNLNPKRRETIKALSGIYFAMYEMEKSAKLKAELDALDK